RDDNGDACQQSFRFCAEDDPRSYWHHGHLRRGADVDARSDAGASARRRPVSKTKGCADRSEWPVGFYCPSRATGAQAAIDEGAGRCPCHRTRGTSDRELTTCVAKLMTAEDDIPAFAE